MYSTIQLCRAIAAVLVVLFHLGATLAQEKYFRIRDFSLPFPPDSNHVQDTCSRGGWWILGGLWPSSLSLFAVLPLRLGSICGLKSHCLLGFLLDDWRVGLTLDKKFLSFYISRGC